LPQDLKELAFKTQVKYAAHPYLWMSKAKARPTGLGMESEGKELTPEQLPEINEEHIKIYPMVSINPHDLLVR
jgi:chlorite dismutase